MNVAIVGCGLIGGKRARALSGAKLVACADISADRARTLAAGFPGCAAATDWRAAVERKDVEVVIVATTHASLAEITLAAVSARKHVLVEKPAGRNAGEVLPVIEAAARTGSLIRVGFNHRYHRAFRKAKEIHASGEMGEMMFVRGRYGHGGRVGYEKEWRADPKLSGGGELIDQGVHLIDLARYFLGDLPEVAGHATTLFWNMPVDDNAFMTLKTAAGQVAFLHASSTEWKNLFSFEIYGKKAKLHIDGLGGSYGTEKLACHRMLPRMGPPETSTWEFPGDDDSWQAEFAEFMEDVRLERRPAASIEDARAALEIVGKIYKESGYDHHP